MSAIEEFKTAARLCSYHHADDSGREWPKARKLEKLCQAMYDAASAEERAEMEKFAKGQLMRLKTGGEA